MKKLLIQLVLTAGIVVMGYLVFESIMGPVRFENEREDRQKDVVQHLKDIRSAQVAYKALNDTFVPSFDTLVKFIVEGQIPIVNIIPDPTDTTFTRTISDTIGFIGVQDSLFKDAGFNAQKLRYIPHTDNVEFALETAKIKRGGVTVSGIEVTAQWEDILWDMDKQLRVNFIKTLTDIDKYPGLKFGSLFEPSIDGNWE
jgi:hypothetical protein